MLFIIQTIVTAAFLLLIANTFKGIKIDNYGYALLAAFVLGILNSIVRPAMIFLTLPFTVVTFGLFLFVINGLLLLLTAKLTPGFKINNFGAAVIGAAVLSLCNLIATWFFADIDATLVYTSLLH